MEVACAEPGSAGGACDEGYARGSSTQGARGREAPGFVVNIGLWKPSDSPVERDGEHRAAF